VGGSDALLSISCELAVRWVPERTSGRHDA
jgi:hypothetical protein